MQLASDSTVLSCNIMGFQDKCENLNKFIEGLEKKPIAICIQSHHVNVGFEMIFNALEGYEVANCYCRPGLNKTGGVCILVKEGLSFDQLEICACTTEFEITAIKLNKAIVIVTLQSFYSQLSKCLTKINYMFDYLADLSITTPVVFTGDFEIEIKDNRGIQSLKDLAEDYYYQLETDLPSRGSQFVNSLVGNCITDFHCVQPYAEKFPICVILQVKTTKGAKDNNKRKTHSQILQVKRGARKPTESFFDCGKNLRNSIKYMEKTFDENNDESSDSDDTPHLKKKKPNNLLKSSRAHLLTSDEEEEDEEEVEEDTICSQENFNEHSSDGESMNEPSTSTGVTRSRNLKKTFYLRENNRKLKSSTSQIGQVDEHIISNKKLSEETRGRTEKEKSNEKMHYNVDVSASDGTHFSASYGVKTRSKNAFRINDQRRRENIQKEKQPLSLRKRHPLPESPLQPIYYPQQESASGQGHPPRKESASEHGHPTRQASASGHGHPPRQESASGHGHPPRQESASGHGNPPQQESLDLQQGSVLLQILSKISNQLDSQKTFLQDSQTILTKVVDQLDQLTSKNKNSN